MYSSLSDPVVWKPSSWPRSSKDVSFLSDVTIDKLDLTSGSCTISCVCSLRTFYPFVMLDVLELGGGERYAWNGEGVVGL